MGPADAVLKYLRDQNRPYSANDIFMNLHKEYGKTAVQKALDQLVQQGKIHEKVYGKQKVYANLQEGGGKEEDMQKELGELDRKLAQASEDVRSVEQRYKQAEKELQDLLAAPITSDAEKELTALEEEVEQATKKLKDLSENTVKISSKDREKILKENELMMKEWRKRRRVCMDIVDAILEGYPKNKKALFEEVGIETDEDAHVSLPT